MLVDICKTASWSKLSKYILGVEIIVCDQKGDTEEQDIMKEMTRRHLIEVDEFQNTPLLLACYNEAPLEAIKALIFLSEVAGDPETILTRDHTNDGASGLLIACATDMALESLQELIFYHLEKDGVESTRDLAIKPDATGVTPINMLFRNQYQQMQSEFLIEGLNKIRLVQYAALGILDEYEVLREEDCFCETDNELNLFAREFILNVVASFPFACVSEAWIRDIDFLYESFDTMRVSRFFNNRIGRQEEGDLTDDHLLPRQPPLLHSAIDVSYADMFGKWSHLDKNTMKTLINAQNIVMNHLVALCPEGTLDSFRMHSQQEIGYTCSVLCRALKCGLWWNSTHEEVDEKDNKIYLKGPIELLSTNDYISAIDPETGLFPFMIASVVVNEYHQEAQQDESDCADSRTLNTDTTRDSPNHDDEIMREIDRYQLSTVYALLRATPVVFDMLTFSRNGDFVDCPEA